MAESIALFFHEAQQSQIQELLDDVAEPIPGRPDEWWYPKDDRYVVVYPYDDLLTEFDEEDLNELSSFFDGVPASILCIELQASFGVKTCESAVELAEIVLSRFRGISDDLFGQIWTDDEIREDVAKETGSFVQSVCYPKFRGTA